MRFPTIKGFDGEIDGQVNWRMNGASYMGVPLYSWRMSGLGDYCQVCGIYSDHSELIPINGDQLCSDCWWICTAQLWREV